MRPRASPISVCTSSKLVERGLADALSVAYVEIAEAEVEYLVEVLVVADQLGVLGRAEVGKDTVLAEHQEERLGRGGRGWRRR